MAGERKNFKLEKSYCSIHSASSVAHFIVGKDIQSMNFPLEAFAIIRYHSSFEHFNTALIANRLFNCPIVTTSLQIT